MTATNFSTDNLRMMQNIDMDENEIFYEKDNGLVYTLNDQKVAVIIYTHWINKYHKNNNNILSVHFPDVILQLMLYYTICPIYRTEFALIHFESLPEIVKMIDNDPLQIRKLIDKKLQLLSTILTQQKIYLDSNRIKNDDLKQKNKIKLKHHTLNAIIIQDKHNKYQNELYDQCKNIKKKLLADILMAMENNKIELDIDLYKNMMECIKTNLMTQYQASQAFDCISINNTVINWELIANGSEDVLNTNLINMHKDRKSEFASNTLKLLFYVFESQRIPHKTGVIGRIPLKLKNMELHNYILQQLKTNKTKDNLIDLLMNICVLFNQSEIEIVKYIFHRIYWYHFPLRPIMRKKMIYHIQTFIYDSSLIDGRDPSNNSILLDDEIQTSQNFAIVVRDYLELFACIISGFCLPIKQIHIDTLLINALIPLLTVNEVKYVEYHDVFIYCISQFCKKDILLIGPIWLKYLMKYWPFKSYAKMELFLQNITEIFSIFVTFIQNEQKNDIQNDQNNNKDGTELFLLQCFENNQFIVDVILRFMKWSRDKDEKQKMMKNMLKIIKMFMDKLLIPLTYNTSFRMSEQMLWIWNDEQILLIIKCFTKTDEMYLMTKLEKVLNDISENYWNAANQEIARSLYRDAYQIRYPQIFLRR